MTEPQYILGRVARKTDAVLYRNISVKAHSTFEASNYNPKPDWRAPNSNIFPTLTDWEDYEDTSFRCLWEHINHIQLGILRDE